MDRTEMMAEVKKNLKLLDGAQDLVISDTILAVCDYCNLSQDCIPDILEPVIRKKVKGSWTMRLPTGPGITRR